MALRRYEWWDYLRGSRVIAEKTGYRWKYWEKESATWLPMTPTRADRLKLKSLARKRRRTSMASGKSACR
jgi:hypothetical protein